MCIVEGARTEASASAAAADGRVRVTNGSRSASSITSATMLVSVPDAGSGRRYPNKYCLSHICLIYTYPKSYCLPHIRLIYVFKDAG